MNLIISLVAAGLFLLLAEIFLPGLIAGICGVLCLVAATALVFIHHGPQAGVYLFMGELVLALIGFLIWMKLFPKTRFGRKFTLPMETNESPLSPDLPGLVNREGKALTSLRPGGTIEIQGRRYDAVSEGQFVEVGRPVQVVKLDGSIIVVRQLQQT